MPDHKGLTDMARTKSEMKESNKPSSAIGGDKYPWGLRINLDEDSLDKLGIGLLKVGEDVEMLAKVSVVSVSVNEAKDSDARRSISLQITHMELCSPEEDGESLAERLYPEKKE